MSQFATYPSLKDRVVFISGGATRNGETQVEHFCAQGAKVAFVDIKAAEGEALADRIAAAGDPKPLFIDCDLKDIPALQAAIRRVGAELGPIGALVNNAAIPEPTAWGLTILGVLFRIGRSRRAAIRG